MDAGAHPTYIDEAMKQLPPLAQPPDPSGGGRERQRNHEHKGREAHGDERPLHDILENQIEREILVHADVHGKMRTRVEEGE